MTPALRRRLFFAALYFSEGAPIGWLWWTLPSQLRRAGVEVDSITALCAATQDVAIDALAIRTVPAHERGSLNGAMQAGQIGGCVAFSSGVLYLAAATGERLAVPMLLSVLALTLLLVAFAPPVLADERGPAPPGRRRRYLRLLLRTPRFWRLVAFASLGGAGFEAAGSLSGSWLVDRGFADGDIATFRLVSAGLMALGALLGGRIADRHGAGRSARFWLAALAITIIGTGFTHSVVSYATMYFGIGGFTAASYALFMQNARGPLAATVFSAFMGLTNACEVRPGATVDLQLRIEDAK